MTKSKIINVNGTQITITTNNEKDYLCLTDMIKAFEDGTSLIDNWLRNKNSIEFLGIWEKMNNPNFNSVEFDGIMMQVGLNRFKLSVKKWIEKTNAIGLIAKAGRYGGTYAHTDIAYHFGMWLSPEFNLLIIKEFQRLKEEELKYLKNPEWLHRRFLTKANYAIQTDAIKEYILPDLHIPKEKEGIIYAQEAELLNVAVFGYTSKEWAEKNPNKVLNGENIRDDASNIQLIALNNAQVLNKELIKNKLSQKQRLEIIRSSTIDTLKSLSNSPTIKKLENNSDIEPKDDFDEGMKRIAGFDFNASKNN